MHGTVARHYGSPDAAALLPHLREYDLPVTRDDILMCVPESYGELGLAERLSQVTRFRADFIAIIGYSFGRNGDTYDDCVSLNYLRNVLRGFIGNVYVIDPQPESVREMVKDVIRSKNVYGVRAYWNVLAHVLMEVLRGRCLQKSINYLCEKILDEHGSRIAFPITRN